MKNKNIKLLTEHFFAALRAPSSECMIFCFDKKKNAFTDKLKYVP